jgi:hypothetical protein
LYGVTPALRATLAATQATATSTRGEVRQRIAELLSSYGGHQALAGFNLYDEPHRNRFGILGFAKEVVVRQSGGAELRHVNIWPSYASPRLALGTSDYETYVWRYCEEVAPPVLCFDPLATLHCVLAVVDCRAQRLSRPCALPTITRRGSVGIYGG